MNHYSDQNQSISIMLVLLMLVSLLFFTMPGQAQQIIGQRMSNIEIYSRCYSRLVGEPLPINDSVRAKLTSNIITPVDACMALFDQAMWESSTSALAQPESKPVALKVIRTLHNLHRTWFQSRNFAALSTDSAERATSLISDLEESPLYITRAALQKNLKYNSVFTTTSGLTGLRYRPNRASVNEFEAQNILRHLPSMPYANSVDLPIAYRDIAAPNNATQVQRFSAFIVIPASQLVQVGALYGAAAPTPITVPFVGRAAAFNSESPPLIAELRAALDREQVNLNLRSHFGGGILGSVGFVLGNTNVPGNTVPFRDDTNHRRLASRIYQDLLCHTNPPLLASDIPDAALSTRKTFTTSKTCMQCHYSYDPLADGYRHLYFNDTAPFPRIAQNESGHAPTVLRSIASVNGSQVYNLQTPSGVLRYRPHLSNSATAVVNLPFNSLMQVGSLLAQQDDPYLCAAKRYYQFLTGIQVPLDSITASTTDIKTQLTIEHQQRVKAYAQVLKTNTVRELFRQIISSEAFRTRNYKAVVGGAQ